MKLSVILEAEEILRRNRHSRYFMYENGYVRCPECGLFIPRDSPHIGFTERGGKSYHKTCRTGKITVLRGNPRYRPSRKRRGEGLPRY